MDSQKNSKRVKLDELNVLHRAVDSVAKRHSYLLRQSGDSSVTYN